MKAPAWLGLTLLGLGACVLANNASAEAAVAGPSTYLAGNWGTATFNNDNARLDYRRGGYGRSYRRRHEDEYDRGVQGWFDIRGGFFDTQDVSKNDWTAGVKALGKVTPQLSLGLSTDLHRR